MVIAQYLEELKQTSAGKGALTSALLSIKWLHNFMPGLNPQLDPANDVFLARIVESSNRNSIQVKKRKKPLTPTMIKDIFGLLPSNPSLSNLRDCLIPVLSYALLLRHDEASHINCNHFSELEDGLKLCIPSSKTDTYREGKTVFLSKNNTALIELLYKYLSEANLDFGKNHFLFGPIIFCQIEKKFVIENRKLPYDVFIRIYKNAVAKLGLNPDDFGTHSARSGGATTLASHISEFNLMLSGRWSDPRSLGSYVETPVSQRFEINDILDINI